MNSLESNLECECKIIETYFVCSMQVDVGEPYELKGSRTVRRAVWTSLPYLGWAQLYPT